MSVSRRALTAGLAALAAGCGRRRDDRSLRVGYLPTLVQAVAVAAAQNGTWRRVLPELSMTAFPNSSAVMEAMRSGSVDVAFASAPAVINTHLRSEGRAIRVLSTVALGGASLLVRSGKTVARPADLAGGTLAVNAIGAMPDISARTWVRDGGEVTRDRGGSITIVPMPAAESFQLTRQGRLDAVWAQEPWASRLAAAGAKRVLDERDLWEGGRMPQVFLVARAEAHRARRDEIKRLTEVVVADVERYRDDPLGVAAEVADALEKQLGKPVPPPIFRDAYPRVAFTTQDLRPEFASMETRMRALGYLPVGEPTPLSALFT